MARWYYLGGQRIDPVRPVVRWWYALSLDAPRTLCAGTAKWGERDDSVVQSHGRAGLEPRSGNPWSMTFWLTVKVLQG
jgi:hypothetical protein